MTHGERAVDPDVWTVLSLLVSTVAMFAQLAQLKSSEPVRGLSNHSTSVAHEQIREELNAASRSCEKLIRLLSKSSGTNGHPLVAAFEFGYSQTFFAKPEFERYKALVTDIANRAGNLSLWTLHLIEIDPGFAAEVGNRIVVEIGSIQQRVNRLFRDRPTNEEVLDECLQMLKAFSLLLDRLEQGQN